YSQAAKIIESRRTKYNDFELIKVIGQGGFGRVELARHKRTRRVYAIKLMSKQHLLDHSQSGYWEERDVMVKASSEWLVACHYAFLSHHSPFDLHGIVEPAGTYVPAIITRLGHLDRQARPPRQGSSYGRAPFSKGSA
ncbi:unnamed protein product, partial [Schistosoma margrebowiei]